MYLERVRFIVSGWWQPCLLGGGPKGISLPDLTSFWQSDTRWLGRQGVAVRSQFPANGLRRHTAPILCLNLISFRCRIDIAASLLLSLLRRPFCMPTRVHRWISVSLCMNCMSYCIQCVQCCSHPTWCRAPCIIGTVPSRSLCLNTLLVPGNEAVG